jgi:hypothetical protein
MTTPAKYETFKRRFNDAIRDAQPRLDEILRIAGLGRFRAGNVDDFSAAFNLFYKGRKPSVKTIQRWATGKCMPSERFQPRICSLLGRSWGYFANGYISAEEYALRHPTVEASEVLLAYQVLPSSLQIDPALESLPQPVKEELKRHIDSVNALIKVLVNQKRPE